VTVKANGKAKKAPRSGWGGRLKQGWRQSEDALRYRDKFPVTLAHLQCLAEPVPGEAPKGYRMKKPAEEQGEPQP
jgi:hypothetical protein